jgi:hypothetical protein
VQPESTGVAVGDSRKAKLLMMFCALGFTVFLLDLSAGAWLWKYVKDYNSAPPTYDKVLAEIRNADPQDMADIALAMHAGWEASEQARSGAQETVVHITIAASFVGLVLFTLCFLLAFLLHQELLRQPGGRPQPMLPDNVDNIWK